jgi:hypothetical protein
MCLVQTPAGRRIVTGPFAATQTCPNMCLGSVARTLRGRVKCPLASGERFVGPAWQWPSVDASSQRRRFGSLRSRKMAMPRVARVVTYLCEWRCHACSGRRVPPTYINRSVRISSPPTLNPSRCRSTSYWVLYRTRTHNLISSLMCPVNVGALDLCPYLLNPNQKCVWNISGLVGDFAARLRLN